MTKKEIDNAILRNQPLYWQQVTAEDKKWHQVKIIGYDATKRRWRIHTPVGTGCVRSGALFPQIIEFGNYEVSSGSGLEEREAGGQDVGNDSIRDGLEGKEQL